MNESGVEKLVDVLTLLVCENFGRGERRPPQAAHLFPNSFVFFLHNPLIVYLCVKCLEYKKSKANIDAAFPTRVLVPIVKISMTLPVSGF